jgi:hypothetical protein
MVRGVFDLLKAMVGTWGGLAGNDCGSAGNARWQESDNKIVSAGSRAGDSLNPKRVGA